MYAISIRSPEGETTYWVGGERFSVDPDDAALFMKEVDADATILILTRTSPGLSDEYAISELPRDVLT